MYCLKCGKQISDDAKFCLFCGAKVVKTNAAQFREIKEVPEKPSRKEIKKQKKELKKAEKAQKKKKKSGFGRFFRRLVLISIAGCLVAAFVYPGYFRDVFDPVGKIRTILDDKLEPASFEAPVDALDNDDPALISIRYTDAEVQSAKGKSAAVTKKKPSVKVNNIKVDMGSYNLSEDDVLVVKDLGRKEDASLGTALHCYDFSLESGKNEFSSLVAITFPLDLAEDEYLEDMVYFNEETKEWDYLYYTVADNGKSVTAYIDHFTKVSPKIRKMTKKMFEEALALSSSRKHSKFITSADKDIVVPADLFVEAWNKTRTDEKNTYLYFQNSPVMRNVGLHMDTVRHLFRLSGKDISATTEDIQESLRQMNFAVESKNVDWITRVLGAGDATQGSIKDLGLLSNYITKGGFKYAEELSMTFSGLNIMATGLKLYCEVEAGKDPEQALKDNDLQVLSAGVSALAILSTSIPALAAWPITLAGIAVFAVSASLDAYKYFEGLDELPLQEQAYFAYYQEKKLSFNGIDALCKMEIPKGLQDSVKSDSFANIQFEVNTLGLDDTCEDVWNEMLSLILKNAEKAPSKAKEYIEDLYYKYADAYWKLPQDIREGWVTQWMMKQGYSEEEISEELSKKVYDSDIETYRQDKINQTLILFQDVLKKQIDRYTTKAFTAFRKTVQRDIINPLNQKIYFRVFDKSLKKGQTFYDSLYCQDYRAIPYNQATYFKKANFNLSEPALFDTYKKFELPEYSDVIASMRFADVEYPLFYPYQMVVENGQLYVDPVKRMDRYPHTPEYLPFVYYSDKDFEKNVVFATTLYHYIQMGSPTRMVFKDPASVVDFESAEEFRIDPGIEVSFTVPEFDKNGQAFVKINLTEGSDINNYEGYWEGPWLGSSKQWYIFHVDTERKLIEITDTYGLPSEDFTIRFYKYDARTRTLSFILGWLTKDKARFEFKMTGKNSMVLYLELNGDKATVEFTRSTKARYDDLTNRQKFYAPDPSIIIPPGDEP